MLFSSRQVQVSAQRSLAAATSPLVARMKRNGIDPGADFCGDKAGPFVWVAVAVGVAMVLANDTLLLVDGDASKEAEEVYAGDLLLPLASGGSGLDLLLGTSAEPDIGTETDGVVVTEEITAVEEPP